MEQIILYKERSYAACISEGFKFLAQHLRMIVKVLLPYFFIAALLENISTYLCNYAQLYVFTHGDLPVMSMLAAILMLTISYGAIIFATARMYLLFRRKFNIETSPNIPGDKAGKLAVWRDTLKRTLKLSIHTLPYTIWPYLIGIIMFIVMLNMSKWITYMMTMGATEQTMPTVQANDSLKWIWLAIVCGMFLFLVALIVFATPLTYTFDCHMMRAIDTDNDKNDKKAHSFRKEYREGFKHLGKILGVNCLCGVIYMIAIAVLILPDTILSTAYQNSIECMNQYGDDVEIPTYAYYITLTASAVASAFALILSVAFHASHVFLYGDIKTKAEQSNR
ncbi:MAG: hypothetical protein IJ145_08350 [Prevotella sp.]|nr:hypothetical protein [Prevotella sp.]